MSDIGTFFAPDDWLGAGRGPRYLQLQRRIALAIESGLIGPGDPLPAEREIASLTGTSRVTVRRAVEALVREGRIVQRQGSGSYVRARIGAGAPSVEPSSMGSGRLASLGEDLALRGVAATTKTLDATLAVPVPDVTVALGLSPGEKVARILRLRLGDGDVIGLEESHLPADVLPKPKKAARGLYAALEATGNRPVRAIQRASAASLGKKDARHLEQRKGTAVLEIHRTGYLASGRPVEITRAVFLAGRFDIVAELRPGAGEVLA